MKLFQKKILALFLAIVLVFSLTSCVNNDKPTPTAKPTAEPTAEPIDEGKLTGSFSDIKEGAIIDTNSFNMDTFKSKANELESLITEKKETEAIETFKELKDLMSIASDVMNIMDGKSSVNVTDEAVAAEKVVAFTNHTEAKAIYLKLANLMAVNFEDAFSKYLDNDVFLDFVKNYNPDRDGLAELKTKETELLARYQVLHANRLSDTIVMDGTEFSFNLLTAKGFYEKVGQDKYYEIYYALWDAYNERVGSVYKELVTVRDAIAKCCGYDNFAVYSDKEIYYRDYSEDDLEKVYATVKEFAQEYYCMTGVLSNFLVAINDISELTTEFEKVLPYLSSYVQESYANLKENRVIVGGSGDQYENGGYCAGLLCGNANTLMYLNMTNASSYEVTTFIHEMGHATDFYKNPINPVYDGCYDIAEIHSSGNEAIAMTVYNKVFSEDLSNALVGFDLDLFIATVIEGCLLDEWQRTVYHNPNMTLAEINEAYKTLALEYGYIDSYGLIQYGWMDTHHNFDSPMYYMSYATSYFVSIQLYEIAKTDINKAIELWEKVIDASTNDYYVRVVESIGLEPLTKSDNVLTILRQALSDIEVLTAKYYE